MSFSENLQFLRSEAGLTQEQLAEQLDVSRQSVSKWESGVSFPEMETLLRICSLYDVNLDLLLRGCVEQSRVSDSSCYDVFMNRFSRRVAFSVGAIIAAVGIMLLLTALGVPDVLSVAGLLLVITISSVVLVAAGIQHEQYRKKHPCIADFYTDEERDSFHQAFIWYIAGGVGAILFGVVFLVLVAAMLPQREPYESLTTAVFLLIVAAAVTGFVYAGIQDEKYKVWKYNRDNAPTPEAKKRLNLIGTICGVIMLTATAMYVGFSAAGDAWDTLWWVFPVGGILCGAVSVLLDPYKGEED